MTPDEKTQANFKEVITSIRIWNRDWDNYAIKQNAEKPKSAEEFVEDLINKYTLTKK